MTAHLEIEYDLIEINKKKKECVIRITKALMHPTNTTICELNQELVAKIVKFGDDWNDLPEECDCEKSNQLNEDYLDEFCGEETHCDYDVDADPQYYSDNDDDDDNDDYSENYHYYNCGCHFDSFGIEIICRECRKDRDD